MVSISGTTLAYSVLASGIAAPTQAHIHRGAAGASGDAVVDLAPTWFAGSATGSRSVSAALASEIVSNPAGFYVNVHNAEFPNGALRGQLGRASSGAEGTQAVLPTVVKATGVNDARYVSDLTLFNPGTDAAMVALQLYLAGGEAKSAPDAATTISVPAGQQVTLLDLLGSTFSMEGSGAVVSGSDVPVRIQHRVLNDQRASGNGTTLLNVPGLGSSDGLTSGTLLELSQASAADQAAGNGFRTNIGFFNAGTGTVSVTFTARAPEGTVIGTRTMDVPAGSRQQLPVFSLIPDAPDPVESSFYVTFTTAGGGLYVYSTVVDNKTGDGVYANAQPD